MSRLASSNTHIQSLGWRVLLTRRWIGYLTLAVVFAVACVGLGFWQFARLDEARTHIARIDANYDAVPVALAEVLADNESFDVSQTWKPVLATGEYDIANQILVRSRPLDGQIGFEVLTPLLMSDGRVFIIDRGWIPSGATTAEPGNVPDPPQGEVTVIARLKPPEPALAGREAVDGTVPTIHLPMIRTLVGPETIVGAYGVLASESPAVEAMPTPPQKPVLDEGPHLSYALQWLLFAIMGFVGLGLAVRNERRIRLGLKSADNRPVIGRRASDESEEDAAIETALSDR
jgi:cytochrome oxidase assembly protein ShyY1